MGASENFNKPNWNNPIDTDLDALRESLNFTLLGASNGSVILPGWDTVVTPGLGDYSEPTKVLLTKGSRAIHLNYVWTDSVITSYQFCYDDGVSSPGLVCFDAQSITYGAAALSTTAKWFGDGSSPSNYYETGYGAAVSPSDFTGLIGAGTYQKLTLVFCVYPVQLGDTDSWYIFGSESGAFIVGNWDLDGGIWLGCRVPIQGPATINTVPAGSPSDYGGLIPGQWNSIMIAFDGDDTVSPETRNVEIWANGSEVFNGQWGSVTNNPDTSGMSSSGNSWVGLGDGFTGDTDNGMNCYLSYVWCNEEYLDPSVYWSSFFDGNNKPLSIGADGSDVTGSPPYTFCPDADFTNNLGTGANWTEIGTVPAAPSSPTD